MFSYDLGSGQFVPGLSPSYQGALFDLVALPLQVTLLSVGQNTLYFGVDVVNNGQLDNTPEQLFYTSTMVEVVAANTPTPEPNNGTITYSYNDQVFRITAQAGATPENVSALLDTLAPGSGDAELNIAPNGEWMVLQTERFDSQCQGWACLAVVNRAVSTGEIIISEGNPVRSEGMAVVDSTGNLIVYSQGDGSHTRDLWAVERSNGTWSKPRLLTADSVYAWNLAPALADDGSRVLFECSEQPYEAKSACEVAVDGSGFRQIITAGNDGILGIKTPDYAPDGSIVLEIEYPANGGEMVWRIPADLSTPQNIATELFNDNSPCVLPDGRIASLWLGRAENPEGVHELKLMSADGSYQMLVVGQDIADIGLGCGK